MLWLHAARVDDKEANAAAAGFSGAAAFFGAGAISFTDSFLEAHPWIKSLWLPGAYAFGCLVVASIVLSAWLPWLRAHNLRVEALLASLANNPRIKPR